MMPNWCNNRVEIYGYDDDEQLRAFKELVTSKECAFDFNKIVPMPKALEETTKGSGHVPSEELIKKYGYDNWYDWRIDNWGTKWELAEDVQVSDDGEYIKYDFETAWAPPEGIYHAIKEKFPDLEVTWFYDEPGMQFAGYL
jgi:hypothetical protein